MVKAIRTKKQIQQDRSITENDYGGFQWLKKEMAPFKLPADLWIIQWHERITAAMKQRLQMNVYAGEDAQMNIVKCFCIMFCVMCDVCYVICDVCYVMCDVLCDL